MILAIICGTMVAIFSITLLAVLVRTGEGE
jgi:hypothetical protein